MRRIYRTAVNAVLGVVALAVISLGVYYAWLEVAARNATLEVRAEVRAVVDACVRSKWTGAYWENELSAQAATVAGRAVEDRLAFHREVLINCDLDTSRALVFVEAVGNDVLLLRHELVALTNSPRYGNLTSQQKERVEAWIPSLRQRDATGP